jgi:hypothetical protein
MQVVSSSTDPEAANALAQSILSGEGEKPDTNMVQVPFIPPPPDTAVKLPGGGLMDADGTLHDDAVVRELTGADEEALSKADATKNMARYVQTITKRGTERIGKYENPDENLLGELLVGDREMLLLAIRRATYGDDMTLTLICPSCASAVDASFDLGTEIPIVDFGDEKKRTLEIRLRDGRMARVRIPTAADQDYVLGLANKTVPEMNTIMMARCMISIDDMPITGQDAVRALGIMDRRTIVKALNEAQPGPKYGEVSLECPGCGRDFPLQIDILSLFRG